ncbi:MAG: hypothetical protein K8F92_05850 [Hyphomicrobium sp.]|uniref:hypothetical protein n=1 Tax=Hyphomicrobium sp. TaxID=82 RepID=UPI001321E405|nr:hypothetical protein [Hyphomicrobium sp.]KAB2941268.1 MAG: hypothetical protein F9K20_10705 [Hyphomicrobium sp.]MBZ0209159.1 hypothetical protein [Hyphomicrobium sp.]
MRTALCAALGLSLLGTSAANAVDVRTAIFEQPPRTLLHKVHSLHQAKHTLRDLGYYDIEVERASLPYSFRACKRGVRYHIHVNYHGDLVQVDELGRCHDYDDDYDYRSRSRYPRYDY